jgi:hypothetical protein
LDTVTGASVSMLFGRRGAKMFFVGNCADEVGTAAFFGEWAASAVECLFRLLTSLKLSAWFDRPAWLLAFRRLLKSVRVRVTLPLAVSESVCLGVEQNLGLLNRYLTSLFLFVLKVIVLSFGGALSDETSGLSFVSLCQYSLQWSVFT